MPRWRDTWAEGLEAAMAWCLPSECLACRRPVAGPVPPMVCGLCTARWRPLDLPSCPRCQHPRLLDLACRMCAEWPPELERARSAVVLDDSVRTVVHGLKYRGWRRLAPLLAGRMLPLLDALGGGDLVPVPTDRHRRWRRGYDQAAELAVALGRLAQRPVVPSRLVRARRAASQVGRTPQERLANLAGIFRAGGGDRPVILVDDVFTTGATLVSASTALRAAGVERIAAITFARAEPPLMAADRRRHSTP